MLPDRSVSVSNEVHRDFYDVSGNSPLIVGRECVPAQFMLWASGGEQPDMRVLALTMTGGGKETNEAWIHRTWRHGCSDGQEFA